MFRRWLDLIGCRVYGHHWWVVSGTEARQGPDETLGIYGRFQYGPCKRCSAPAPDDEWTVWQTHTVHTTNVSMIHKDDRTDIYVEHKVEILP